jgi:hypothetical protein
MGLAYKYLRERNYEAAEEPLQKLADLQEGSAFKPFGIAGLFVVYTYLNRENDAIQQPGRLRDSEAALARLQTESPEMHRLYQEAHAELQRRAGMLND